MKEFQQLLVANLQETVIAPALMRVGSIAVAHPNAVRTAVPQIRKAIKNASFVHSSSDEARQQNSTIINNINRTENKNLNQTHLTSVGLNNRKVQNTTDKINRSNNYTRELPQHIVQSQQRRQFLNDIKHKPVGAAIKNNFSQNYNKTSNVLGAAAGVGRTAYSALLNQLN